MDANFLSPNAMLIQGATMSDLESMMSRILDKKLANIGTVVKFRHYESIGRLSR